MYTTTGCDKSHAKHFLRVGQKFFVLHVKKKQVLRDFYHTLYVCKKTLLIFVLSHNNK